MRRIKGTVVCALLSGSVMCSSCIGSFGLWNSLKDWNEGIGDNFVNEIVFLAFHIVPVYEAAYLADIIVLNSVEFWSGSNPLAENVGKTREVKGQHGDYLVRTNKDGYTITKKGEEDKPLDLVYNKEKKSWNAVAEGETFEVATINDNGTITIRQTDGTPVVVTPDAQGMAMARVATGISR